MTWKSVSYFPSLDGWLLDCQWSSVSLSHLQRCLPFDELVSQETSLSTGKYLECCWQRTYHFPLKPRGIGPCQGDMALCLSPSCDSFLPVAKYLRSSFSQVPPSRSAPGLPGFLPPGKEFIFLHSCSCQQMWRVGFHCSLMLRRPCLFWIPLVVWHCSWFLPGNHYWLMGPL